MCLGDLQIDTLLEEIRLWIARSFAPNLEDQGSERIRPWLMELMELFK